ncbi:MAG: hypothetical protein ACETVU_05610, partial [Desulfatiglandales bacterium]
ASPAQEGAQEGYGRYNGRPPYPLRGDRYHRISRGLDKEGVESEDNTGYQVLQPVSPLPHGVALCA